MQVDEHPGGALADQRNAGQRMRSLLHTSPWVSPALVLVVTTLLFGQVSDRFLRPENLSLILQQVAVVGALAVAQTLIVLTAGIDLSVGAMMVLSSLVMARLVAVEGWPAPAALLAGLIVGALAGLINGLLVTRLRLPPFIATLGTLNVFTAASLRYSGGQTTRGADLPGVLTWTGHRISVGSFSVTTGVLLMLGLYVVVAFALKQTAWGRHVYAVGDDAESAALAGIRVNRVLLSVYIAAGVIVALTAWILIGRINAAGPNAGTDANLDSITAVVIGGTSLFGGRGAIAGTLIGALIVAVFRNGLALAGVDVLYQTLAVGVLIIVAVAVDQWNRRARR